jgi:Domain of unknown function (DUF4386)
MSTSQNAPRLLGAAFLGVVATSLIGGLAPITSTTGSGSVSEVLASVAGNVTLTRFAVLGGMFNCAGIVILAALLYAVLSDQNKTIAVIALGLWWGEAIFYAAYVMGLTALIPLSLDFIKAGSPDSSYFQAVGEFLYGGLCKFGMTALMFFYCSGGLLWYYLFFKSRLVPRALSIYGLAAVSLGMVGIVLELVGNSVPMLVYIPIGPFEIVIGTWLLVRGIANAPATPPATAH